MAEMQKGLNVQPCQAFLSRSDREQVKHRDLGWMVSLIDECKYYKPSNFSELFSLEEATPLQNLARGG